MTLEEIDNYINKKINYNENIIIFTFYELRVKLNLTEEETINFIQLTKIRLENLNYKVYLTGEKYIYSNLECIVKDNELLVAIKRNSII